MSVKSVRGSRVSVRRYKEVQARDSQLLYIGLREKLRADTVQTTRNMTYSIYGYFPIIVPLRILNFWKIAYLHIYGKYFSRENPVGLYFFNPYKTLSVIKGWTVNTKKFNRILIETLRPVYAMRHITPETKHRERETHAWQQVLNLMTG